LLPLTLIREVLYIIEEVWKDIPNFEGRYMVSNLGRIKSMKYRHHNKEEILKQESNQNYKRVCLYTKDGKRHHFGVHRLVAMAFLPNPNNYNEINHKDENPSNNCIDNLEWCEHTYNINYGTRTQKARLGIIKPIEQYDKNNNFIKKYNSITEIEKEFNFNRSNIIACAKGRISTAYGFKWKYANQYKKVAIKK